MNDPDSLSRQWAPNSAAAGGVFLTADGAAGGMNFLNVAIKLSIVSDARTIKENAIFVTERRQRKKRHRKKIPHTYIQTCVYENNRKIKNKCFSIED